MFTNPRSRKFLVRGSALCTVALLGVACGGAGEDDTAGSADTGDVTDPLFEDLLDGKTFEEAEFEVQKQVQECMTALGWEYTAVAPGSTGGGPMGAAVTEGVDEMPGYGISTFSTENIVPIGDAGGGSGSASNDPNQNYINTLSAADQTAYYNDLFGTPPADADPNAPIEMGGCYAEANDAVYGENAFEQLDNQFQEVNARVDADPRIVEAYAAWSACMSDAGYSYSNPNEPITDISTRYQALGQSPSPDALKAFQDEEIATAEADRKCAEETKTNEIARDVFEEISKEVASGS